MSRHTVEEAVTAVWTGSCERHDGEEPYLCGAVEDLISYQREDAPIESWHLRG